MLVTGAFSSLLPELLEKRKRALLPIPSHKGAETLASSWCLLQVGQLDMLTQTMSLIEERLTMSEDKVQRLGDNVATLMSRQRDTL